VSLKNKKKILWEPRRAFGSINSALRGGGGQFRTLPRKKIKSLMSLEAVLEPTNKPANQYQRCNKKLPAMFVPTEEMNLSCFFVTVATVGFTRSASTSLCRLDLGIALAALVL